MKRRGVDLSIIVDRKNLENPSCAKEQSSVVALMEWGVPFRMRRPHPGMTSAQHEKCWLFDETLLVCGSMNLTENSVWKCGEAAIFTKEVNAVKDFVQHFPKVWNDATPIDIDMVKGLMAKREASRSKSSKSSASND